MLLRKSSVDLESKLRMMELSSGGSTNEDDLVSFFFAGDLRLSAESGTFCIAAMMPSMVGRAAGENDQQAWMVSMSASGKSPGIGSVRPAAISSYTRA